MGFIGNMRHEWAGKGSPGDGMIRDGWYCCPNCGRKLFKVEPGALAEGISVKCKGTKEQKCGRVVHVKIKN